MNPLAQLEERCSRWIEEIARICRNVDADEIETALRQDLASAIADPAIRVVACGEWNTGKSSLINALVGLPDLLPVSAVPTSRHITVVEKGSQTCYEVCKKGAATQSLTREEFIALSSRDDPGIARFRVRTPLNWCTHPLVLVDTPGLEDISQCRQEITLQELPQADVILLILNAVGGLHGTEKRFVQKHLSRESRRRVMVVINRIDLLNSSEDAGKVLENCRSNLIEELPDSPWVTLSTQGCDSEKSIVHFREELLNLVCRERGRLLAARFGRSAHARIEVLAQRLATEEAMLLQPLATVENEVIGHRKKAIETQRKADVLFQNARQSIRDSVEQWLEKEIPPRLDQLAVRLETEIDNLGGMQAIKYIEDGDAARLMTEENLKMTEEFLSEFQKILTRVEKDLLELGLSSIATPQMKPEPSQGREVHTIFRHVPEPLVKSLEYIFAALTAKHSGKLGNVPRDHQLWQSLGEAITTNRLKKAARAELPYMIQGTRNAFEKEAERVTEEILKLAREFFEQRVRAVESALNEACSRLKSGREEAERRRREIVSFRIGLENLENRLAGFVEDAPCD